MKPQSPTIFTITIILAITIHFPATRCQETQPYDVCSQSVKCGELELRYPFWGVGRPAYCGHPGFQLTCESDVPILSYGSVNYRVLDSDIRTQTINIARNDLWANLCPQYLYNTTYNTTLFNGSTFNQENVLLYYGCNSSIPDTGIPLGANYSFSCNLNNTPSDGYFYTSSLIINSLAECNNRIIVPVDPSFGDRLMSGNTSYLRSALRAGFNLQWMANNDVCDQCIRNEGICGSNSTLPELFVCYQTRGIKGAKRRRMLIIISTLCGIAGITLLLFVILWRKKRFWKTQGASDLHGVSRFLGTAGRNHQIEIFIRNYGSILAPKRFKYSEIKKMTKSFQEKLGKGGYGTVYKGELPDRKLVAVKLLNEATGDGEDFINEVASIGRTSHVNIVTLLGFCIEGKKRALMYEFMPNGSLDKFLRGDGPHLDWLTLFQIAKGIARGLEYLHRGCNTRIVHFDIKPHNILLDKEFVPKISDFGLAKLCKTKQSIVSVIGARGTAGYMAPEVFFRSFGGASHKSDVYSYGMMVLEMTGAHKNNNANITSVSEEYFPDWIYKQVESRENVAVDGVRTEDEEKLARKMMIVSLWCIQSDPSERPSISKAVEMLEGSIESLQIPPRRFWSSPTMPDQVASTLQSSTSERLLPVQPMGEDIS